MTRAGIYTLVKRCASRACIQAPSLQGKNVSPHVIRHTTASHLLQAGVDINTIRGWLGHVSLTTTNIYAEIDLTTKARALAACTVKRNGERFQFQKPLRSFTGMEKCKIGTKIPHHTITVTLPREIKREKKEIFINTSLVF